MVNKSFTLIELVVAIFLLTVGTAGAFSLIHQTTRLTSTASSQLTAAYLAQEGIEVVRNIRDSNYLSGLAWDSGLSASTDYKLDYRSIAFPDAGCGNYLQESGGYYACSSDSNAKFQRQITIEKPAANKMKVSVQVTWQDRGQDHQVVAQTELYDWH